LALAHTPNTTKVRKEFFLVVKCTTLLETALPIPGLFQPVDVKLIGVFEDVLSCSAHPKVGVIAQHGQVVAASELQLVPGHFWNF
jgi:hypothetical protein